MRFVRVFDRKTNEIIRLVVQSDNIIQDQYFTRTFPGATGIKYKEGDSNEFIRFVRKSFEEQKKIPSCLFSIPLDANGSFLWEWDLNVLYELIYRDGKKFDI